MKEEQNIWNNIMKTFILKHHGIEGQRWGVRNGPPYTIEDKVLKKGTKLNSISGTYVDSENYKNSGRWMYTYRQDDEWDNKVYKGAYAKYLVAYKGAKFIREHEYETVKDLKMPNSNERFSEFKKMCDDPKTKDVVKKDLDQCRKNLVAYNVGNEKEREQYRNFDSNKIKSAEDYKVAYNIFNHAMEAVHASESTREYAKRMSEKYDAMVDDNNQGTYNDTHDPIIIFKANEYLKDISNPASPKFLTANDIINNYQEVRQELEKNGKRVKL